MIVYKYRRQFSTSGEQFNSNKYEVLLSVSSAVLGCYCTRNVILVRPRDFLPVTQWNDRK